MGERDLAAAASAVIDADRRAAARERQSILARLNDPDEAMVEAFFKARDEYDRMKADRVFPRPSQAAFICRALATHLSDNTGRDDNATVVGVVSRQSPATTLVSAKY